MLNDNKLCQTMSNYCKLLNQHNTHITHTHSKIQSNLQNIYKHVLFVFEIYKSMIQYLKYTRIPK